MRSMRGAIPCPIPIIGTSDRTIKQMTKNNFMQLTNRITGAYTP